MQREVDPRRSADVPLYSCPPRIHLDPDFQIKSVMSYLMQSEKYEDEDVRRAAAERVVGKCRRACER